MAVIDNTTLVVKAGELASDWPPSVIFGYSVTPIVAVRTRAKAISRSCKTYALLVSMSRAANYYKYAMAESFASLAQNRRRIHLKTFRYVCV